MAAGLGFIEFTTGDVLTAATANGYLASQTVMVFASAAARTSAIASPQEGMISYLKDTNAVEYYSGSAWAAVGGGGGGGGKVLQVLQTTYSTQVNVTSTTYTDTGLSLSITPSASTSKVLVMINQDAEITRAAPGAANGVKIVRGATDVFVQAGGGYETYAIETSGSSVYGNTIISMCYLDSPATTSATTYKTQGKVTTASSGASIKFQQGSTGLSTITLMEIGA